MDESLIALLIAQKHCISLLVDYSLDFLLATSYSLDFMPAWNGNMSFCVSLQIFTTSFHRLVWRNTRRYILRQWKCNRGVSGHSTRIGWRGTPGGNWDSISCRWSRCRSSCCGRGNGFLQSMCSIWTWFVFIPWSIDVRDHTWIYSAHSTEKKGGANGNKQVMSLRIGIWT